VFILNWFSFKTYRGANREEGNCSELLIQRGKNNKITWITIGGQFTTDKSGLATFSHPKFNLKK
jgi:CTP:phosphocholine cytidylyltransferase-like protein